VSLAAGPQRRVGVFGGAFDPPHAAHSALVMAALEQLQLDELLVVPTGEAWHKSRGLTPAVHRLEMVRLAFARLDRVVVDPREVRRNGPSYTVDTLAELRDEMPIDILFLIIGEDQATALTTWHRWREIPDFATICVAARAGIAGARSTFDALTGGLVPFQTIELPPMDISATDIRERLATRQSVVPLVFEPVARYIAHHHLYQTA
jgi:nicotinate-nucleotide adenylyltransferase